MENLLRKYYKGRTLTRDEIFALYNERSYTTELKEFDTKQPLEKIPFKGYVHTDYNGYNCLIYHKGCCYVYKIEDIYHAQEYSLQEIIKVKGEYIEKVMVYSNSTIGRLLYGTLAKNTTQSVTLTDCVEIDFEDSIIEPNLGNLASSVTKLKYCEFSPVIQEITCYDVVFIFSVTPEVKGYLDNIINQKQNNHEQAN